MSNYETCPDCQMKRNTDLMPECVICAEGKRMKERGGSFIDRSGGRHKAAGATSTRK